MIFVHKHYYVCTPYLVDFIATNVVSGNAKALVFGAIRVGLIEVNVDLSLHISMDMSMHISRGASMDLSMDISWVISGRIHGCNSFTYG